MIRPKPARWFEILSARDDATRVLTALAATQAVELEPRSAAATAEPIAPLLPLLAQFDALESRFGKYWPHSAGRCSTLPEAPVATLQRALVTLRAWSQQAEPLIAQLQAIEAERAELLVWQDVLGAMGNAALDFEQLGRPGPVVHKRLFIFPPGARLDLPPGVMARHVGHDAMQCILAVGTEDALRALAQQASALKARVLDAPTWLKASAVASLAYVPPRLHALERNEAALQSSLDALETRHDLGRVLGDAHCLQWVAQNVGALEATDLFCWITGWTSDLSGKELATAVEHSGARALLHFPQPAATRNPPLLMRNPWWARPFEIFSRALGMPSRNEADPSALLALAVPLMFGYMFGDVGQGLVIAAAAFALRKRFAVARLLVAGGVSAAVFGLLFGSVFSIHVGHALWVRPLDAPLPVLLVPIAGGAVLLLIGLLLGAAEAYWRGEWTLWATTDSGLLLAYVSIIMSAFVPAMLFLALAGMLVYALGHGMRERKIGSAFAGLAEFIERMVQLLINTLSFARVGAFALAHAGLSSAIVALMDAGDHPIAKALVLVLGNALVLALETMVVSIQTTRLVLFEFFTRFLVAEGRVFRPLPPPPTLSLMQETK